MKDLQEFLSERELFVIENHPAMSYAKIGERLGITGNRVAQIKTMALRKIREEKRREEAWKRGQQKVDYALTRSQCYLVIRALGEYALYLTPSNIRARNNPKYEPDPDIARCEALIESLRAALNEKSNDNPNG